MKGRVWVGLKFAKEMGRRIWECPFVYEHACCTVLKVSIHLTFFFFFPFNFLPLI